MRKNKLLQIWQERQTAINAWLTIPSAWTAEVLAHAKFDAMTIDMQHGLADYDMVVSMLQAISTTDVVPLVRVPWNDPAAIMRILDGGAYGIVCPMLNNRAETEAFVGACSYPPSGYRSYGPIRADVYAGGDYIAHANDIILKLAMIETVQALRNLDEIIATPGLTGVYVGPMDLSIDMGLEKMGDLNDPQMSVALDKILASANRCDKIVGIHAKDSESAVRFSKRGFRLITPVNDTTLLRDTVTCIVKRIRKDLI